MRILVVDSEASSAEVIGFALSNAGFEVVRASSGRAALLRASDCSIGAVVLDQALSDMSGFEFCRLIREAGDTPVVMLTGCGREETVLRAFSSGADDVMIKPVRMAELVARLQAIVRRVAHSSREGGPTMLERGPFRLDQSRLEVMVAGRHDPVRLTPLEAKLLGLLMTNVNQVMSKARLQELIWGYQNDSSGDLLKTHIRHVRVKLEALPSLPKYIQTITGVGYTFVLPKSADLTVPPLTFYPEERAAAVAS